MDPATPASPGPPAGGPPADDPDQEVDVWWGAYSGRALWPSFVLCVALTGLLLWSAWPRLGDGSEREALLLYAAYLLAGTIWLVQLLRLGYYTVGVNYRLTNRRLFRDRGFHRPAGPGVELVRLRRVWVQKRPLDRLVGVGRVWVEPENGRPLALDGVFDPEGVAALLRRTAESAREKGPAGSRESADSVARPESSKGVPNF